MTSSSIITRHYQGEFDLQQIVDLLDTCERVDRVESSISIDRLRLSFDDPLLDLDRNLMFWENTSGQLIGFGKLSIMEPTEDNIAGQIEFTQDLECYCQRKL
jgi:mycothiol synthase